ncbi:MAG: NADH-quinone oxidoreductase subunit A [Deltaproteobacteria bacterium]|nr:MAG: NADH-quinone oxidoreductase subunit A [Deltaproteobacteria bacterium]
MSETCLIDYMYIFFFLLGGFLAAFTPFIIAHLVRPKTVNYLKTFQTYECGMTPFGNAWDFRYGVAYYLYALMFLAFDVDILYLFPVAEAFDKISSVRCITEFFIFIGILVLAIVYAWVKGVFTWEKQKTVL